MIKNICVFAASSDGIDRSYFDAAHEFGVHIGDAGGTLVFGGGTRGLMGAVARGVHETGGRVIAIIPHKLNRPEIVYATADRLIVTDTLRQRKEQMDALADAFVALPGGFGTLEELMEAVTLKQLAYHMRPVVLINTQGFYDPFVTFLESMYERRFVPSEYSALYYVAPTPADAMAYLRNYAPVELPSKLAAAPSV